MKRQVSQYQMRDQYQDITDRIIAAIEAGASGKQWQMPWHAVRDTGMPHNAVTKHQYRGVNVMVLSITAAALEYPTNSWATYRQWASVGAQVQKGAHGQPVCYYGSARVREDGAEDGDSDKVIRYLKFSHVFNLAQVDNPPAFKPDKLPALAERIAGAEQLVAASGAMIQHKGGRAFYSPSTDSITMPPRDAFKNTKGSTATENYYGTLLHELVHWTGAKHRLDRLAVFHRFGSEAYAMEELAAEIGSAYLTADLHIRSKPSDANAQYVANWLKVLRSDKRAIFTASAKASAASEYLHRLAGDEADQAQEAA